MFINPTQKYSCRPKPKAACLPFVRSSGLFGFFGSPCIALLGDMCGQGFTCLCGRAELAFLGWQGKACSARPSEARLAGNSSPFLTDTGAPSQTQPRPNNPCRGLSRGTRSDAKFNKPLDDF